MRHKTRSLGLGLVGTSLWLSVPGPSLSQASGAWPEVAAGARSELAAGARVRVVRTHSQPPLRGVLVSISDDHLRLRPAGPGNPRALELQVPLSEVVRLDVSEGRGHNVGKGALVGGGVGLGIGLLVAAATPGCSGTGWYEACFDGAGQRVGAAATLTALGAATGVLFAALFPGERWREAVVPALVPEVLPAGGPGPSVGVGLRF